MTNKSKDIESESHPEDNFIDKWKRKITKNLIVCTSYLGILFFLVGICAQFFFEERTYVFIFGLICLLPITNGILYYVFWGTQSPIIVLVMSLINLSWIVAAIVLLLVYRLWLTNSFFDDDVVFQLCLSFYILTAIVLAVFYYFTNQSLAPDTAEPITKKKSKEFKVEEKPDSKEKSKKKRRKE